ncbi:hypothetical protein KJ855_04745, partial [Patescibacteria group bacterium]|nr:hypothetical protein [Patescibacteria group bacterium]
LIMNNKKCQQCSIEFQVLDEDLIFLEKVSPEFGGRKYLISPPTLCPTCRLQRRLSHRNERKLYRRKCDATGKDIVSLYSPNKPFAVCDQQYWWSDKWNPMDYGREFDFNRPFFDQFKELYDAVPKANIMNSNSENSEYTNLAVNNKNCYMLMESSDNEDCYYDYWIQLSKDLVDSTYCHECEIGYEISDCRNCYNLHYSRNCFDSRDSLYLEDCRGCSNCFACSNLQNKDGYAFNRKVEKEQMKELLKIYNGEDQEEKNKLKKQIDDFFAQQPMRGSRIINSENCTGDYIVNSKDVFESFDVGDSENVRYSSDVFRDVKDVMDVSTTGLGNQLMHEAINTAVNVYRVAFTGICWYNLKNVYYCMFCFKSQDLFGCVGIHDKKQYCILNKQYTKEEYEKLVPKIIEHMKETGEWGEFFPMWVSAFGYNETVAQDHFVLIKDEAVKVKANWEDEDFTLVYEGEFYVPLPIGDYKIDKNPEAQNNIDNCMTSVLKCEKSGRPFRILPQELAFYIKHNIELPRIHPDVRHVERISKRHHYRIKSVNCGRCGKDFMSSVLSGNRELLCGECIIEGSNNISFYDRN